MNINEILQFLIDNEGSDIHIISGSPLSIRINGVLSFPAGPQVIQAEQAQDWIFELLSEKQKEELKEEKEIDLAYQFGDNARFRICVYQHLGNYAAALRLIPQEVKDIDQLGLPKIFHQFGTYNQGLVLFTGPTGEGKSTSLAAIIDEINHSQSQHIITIEDPVEFVYQPDKSVISQRELGKDTHEWHLALRSALRSDPDVVLVGEMRDLETISSTLTLAETGHLVFATIHTNTAAQTIDRIIDVFPAHQQGQIRQQLASVLKVIVSQRLVPKIHGGRTAAVELLFNNAAVANLIRDEKVFQIDTIIQTNISSGMMLMESHLLELYKQKVITKETAIRSAFRPTDMLRLLEEE
ncbi:MAG: PilT/PilU family type 4a pilus ATPase [Candidatus Pacebacteria bacterium]|jgi:twitching motility protein PilT|nr:PilT/PilU family type 4a pilus ATPase [Candidatus Paceibacterota bacterium]